MSETGTDITGGCLCGRVRFRSSAPPLVTRYCWCRDCQHFAAGSPTVNVAFPSDAVTIEGDPTDYVSTSDGGNRMHRSFCPTCGSPMFSQAEVRPNVIIIRAGALDDANVAEPSLSIWTDSAPHWACIDADLPMTPKQPG
jgi:hypothetical protein